MIENEFGKGLGIESAIAKDGADGSSLEGFFELANGCICCSVKNDLLATLEVLVQRKSQFDYVIIETSGLADPGPVASCLWVDEELESQLRLDGIVTVVDAKYISRHIHRGGQEGQTFQEGSHLERGKFRGAERVTSDVSNVRENLRCPVAREEVYFREEAFRQICVADRIVLNKTDLVPEEDTISLEDELRGLNGMARIQRTLYSHVDLDFVLGLECYSGKTKEDPLPFLSCGERNGHGERHSHGGVKEVTTLAIVEPVEVDGEAVKRWLADLLWRDDPADGKEEEREDRGRDEGIQDSIRASRCQRQQIYRMKGTLSVAGSDMVHILQAVHETFELEASQTPARGGGEGEAAREGGAECRLVIIGKALDEACLRAGFLATVSSYHEELS